MPAGTGPHAPGGLHRLWQRLTGIAAHRRRERRLIELSLHYWEPVYAYLRRHSGSDPAARRLTAAFFRDLGRRAPLHALDRADGRFREFLLTELRRFLERGGDRGER